MCYLYFCIASWAQEHKLIRILVQIWRRLTLSVSLTYRPGFSLTDLVIDLLVNRCFVVK